MYSSIIVLAALLFFNQETCFPKRAGLEHSSPYSLMQSLANCILCAEILRWAQFGDPAQFHNLRFHNRAAGSNPFKCVSLGHQRATFQA
jgi:hypothetical protein